MALAFVKENMESRQRLESLVRRLSDEEMARSTSYGWTIAALLAHMAFWDQRMLALIKRWQENGVDESPVDSEAMNEACKPLCHAIPPRAAAELCLASAAECDAALERMTPELVEVIQASRNQFRFARALHRNEHVKDIEELLSRK